MKSLVIVLGAMVLLAWTSQARASVIDTVVESGPDVVLTGSGSFDLTALTLEFTSSSGSAEITPSTAFLGTGTSAPGTLYSGLTGPSSFGSGGGTYASSSSGDFLGLSTYNRSLIVPSGYVSGSSLSTKATWDNASYASLGLTPGTYEWTWGSGADADSFTLNIAATAPVPEPSSLALLAPALLGLGSLVRQGKRRAS